MSPPAQWEVLGDCEGEGLPVRETNEFSAPPGPTKLSKGSVVEQVRLVGEQLEYKLVKGAGPKRGWVLTCAGCRCPFRRYCPAAFCEQAKRLDVDEEAVRFASINHAASAVDVYVNVKTGAGLRDQPTGPSPAQPAEEEEEEEKAQPPAAGQQVPPRREEAESPAPSEKVAPSMPEVPEEPLVSREVPEMMVERCKREWEREASTWQLVGMETLAENYKKELPGIRYGINFPHTPELLETSRYGAKWLTKAFHLAGTLPSDNAVKKIRKMKPVSGGGACLKACFEVEYEKDDPGLHKKLFFKYPFDFENPKQRNDRMNSSVNLQPGDLAENDAYRLLEATLPFPMPKYYFGDINNQSTNFILITEFIPFGDKKKNIADFKPGEVEPAYDKFLDDEQLSSPIEYYRLMTKANATMAGWYKAGRLGDKDKLLYFFYDQTKFPQAGLAEAEFKSKLNMGEEFLKNIAHFFPSGLINATNLKEWRRVLNIVNTYKTEIMALAGSNDDYLAVAHGNLNVDNTWWWRDEQKKLFLGVLDWGGLGKVCLPQKLWWSYYSAELHLLEDHLDELLQLFVATYRREGGPALDMEVVRRDFMFAALDQCIGLLGAIPAVYRVISKKAWTAGEVKDRNDQRLRDNFLTRMYVMGLVLVTRMIFRFNLGKLCDDLRQMPGMPQKKLAEV